MARNDRTTKKNNAMNLYSAGLNSSILDRLYHKIFNLSQAKKKKNFRKKKCPIKVPSKLSEKVPRKCVFGKFTDLHGKKKTIFYPEMLF